MKRSGVAGSLINIVCALACLAPSAWGQQLEHEPRPQGEPPLLPYLAEAPVSFQGLLSGPPSEGSILDKADEYAIELFQGVPQARWQLAEQDGRFVFPRFEDALGHRIDRQGTPALVHLLNRALRDVSATTFAAKDYFSRPRPYQRLSLHRVCGAAVAPTPEAHPTRGSSYPSGHSAYGWAVAMILARVRPEQSQALMTRAAEYAESRLICGVHFPSDIEAGHTVAAAVLNRLDDSPEFQRDVQSARAELRVH